VSVEPGVNRRDLGRSSKYVPKDKNLMVETKCDKIDFQASLSKANDFVTLRRRIGNLRLSQDGTWLV
jgi:hypothetical protein